MIPQPFEDLIRGMEIVGALDQRQGKELRDYLEMAIERDHDAAVRYRVAQTEARKALPWYSPRRWWRAFWEG